MYRKKIIYIYVKNNLYKVLTILKIKKIKTFLSYSCKKWHYFLKTVNLLEKMLWILQRLNNKQLQTYL